MKRGMLTTPRLFSRSYQNFAVSGVFLQAQRFVKGWALARPSEHSERFEPLVGWYQYDLTIY
ncbi:hypothetical protein HALO113_70167 [Halomonas sp. 113]|nr:hypothetical protein HALO156_150001 [Halomonas sp. 156]CAD5278971.1 hypothetical protein HALO113_70167 [Halomonas sp. 113]CAD5286376.1 hypothetical protein HALOI3_40169 [Halomonas sp. I3]VXB05778.1 hypothetical protein HALO153_100169 [Halomonas titanicae]